MDETEDIQSIPKKEKKKRRTNPLTKKDKKPEVLKNLDKLHKLSLSKGDELIKRLSANSIAKVEESIISDNIIEETTPEEPEHKIEDEVYVTENINGVEVVDVKAIEKNKKVESDKFGIPIAKGEYRNFDKI